MGIEYNISGFPAYRAQNTSFLSLVFDTTGFTETYCHYSKNVQFVSLLNYSVKAD